MVSALKVLLNEMGVAILKRQRTVVITEVM